MSKAVSNTRLNLSDGVYKALWSGYTLTILSNKNEEMAVIETIDGVRGINCPVKVEVEDGIVTVLA